MNKQAVLEQVYENSFNDEFEKVALSFRLKANYIKAIAKKTEPFRKRLGQHPTLQGHFSQVDDALKAASLPKKGILNRFYGAGGRAQINEGAKGARGTYDYLKAMPAAARG